MQKIVFCGDWVNEQAVGMQRYVLQILLELDRMLQKGSIKNKIELLVPKNVKWESPFQHIDVVKIGKIVTKLDKHIWEQCTFPMYVKFNHAIGIDLAGALPIWGCKIVALLDCIHEVFPENFIDHKKHLKIHLFKARCIAKNSNCQIVTLTNDSKSELIKYYNIISERIHIVTCGWEHMLKIQADDSIFEKISEIKDSDYFFALGSKYKHKNFDWIIKTARMNPNYKFVITGSDFFSDTMTSLKKNKPMNVIFTGYISDGEIKYLMQNCKALIQPSFYEGFGLPPLEALSLGRKIIVSNKSALPEIYKGSAYYIDPYSNGCNLDDLLQNQHIVDCKCILTEYSWKNAASQLLEVINLNSK